jgi:1-aminocyclopropane-1-carboxylate deaminase/D-cysteine desulfhydrase-like pyridoxal-dependent ACC family enzyme
VVDAVPAGTLHFYVKREDLASPKYGGNKVRTLQHQIAVCEAKAVRGDKAASKVVVAGTGGSNQVLATVVHSQNLAAEMPKITPVWMQKDVPDLDNTLNLLSTLTMTNVNGEGQKTWGDSGALSALLGPVLLGSGLVLPPGGNSPTGVIGQIGGALELAEQIERGEMPDPDRIYLAVGSSCTISGLILGIALSRQLGLRAFKRTQVCGVPIHHTSAAGQRGVGVLTAWWATKIPLTIRHTINIASEELARLGGPELLDDALAMVDDGEKQVRLIADADIVGTYGGHSDVSLVASNEYDETGVVVDVETGEEQLPLWLCGHFTSKAFAAMRRDFVRATKAGREPSVCLFWQTKSQVQPRGEDETEWQQFLALPTAVVKWGARGKSASARRKGVVDTKNVSTGELGYRHLMKKVVTSKL